MINKDFIEKYFAGKRLHHIWHDHITEPDRLQCHGIF